MAHWIKVVLGGTELTLFPHNNNNHQQHLWYISLHQLIVRLDLSHLGAYFKNPKPSNRVQTAPLLTQARQTAFERRQCICKYHELYSPPDYKKKRRPTRHAASVILGSWNHVWFRQGRQWSPLSPTREQLADATNNRRDYPEIAWHWWSQSPSVQVQVSVYLGEIDKHYFCTILFSLGQDPTGKATRWWRIFR